MKLYKKLAPLWPIHKQMIEELATVIECKGDFAIVEAQRTSVCGKCSVNKGCGTFVLSKVVGNKVSRVYALNHAHATLGDEVIIGIPEDSLLKLSLITYIFPLMMMIGFAMLGQVMATQLLLPNVTMEILFAVGGLLLSFVLLKRFNLKIQHDARYQPVILRKNHSVIPKNLPDLLSNT